MSFSEPWFYIVLLGAAALGYAVFLPGRSSSSTSSKGDSSSNLEATLEQYMLEFEQENEELIDLVAQMKQDLNARQLAQQEQISELRKRIVDIEFTLRQQESRMTGMESSPILQPPVSAAPDQPASKKTANQVELIQEIAQAAVDVIPDEPETEDAENAENASSNVRDRYPELFELYAKGKSMDAIAKSIGLQRGEVQLILQLAKREGSQ